jgi:phospholipid-binding lipoprotein MlaA
LKVFLVFLFSIFTFLLPVNDTVYAGSADGAEQQKLEKNSGTTDSDQLNAKEKISDEYGNVTEEQIAGGEGPSISDPLEPWNRSIYYFNDKVYFWALKPAAQGYKFIIPEEVRGLVSNFYKNIRAPIRIVNNLLQGKMDYAGIELARLLINTTIGVGGLRDCATECFNVKGRDTDFGQTLGRYGIGHGFYFVLPFLGPSSSRDSVGLAVDWSLKPTTYLGGSDWINPENVGIYVHEAVNTTSFRIGDYETLKGAAVDPYVAMRDIYIQYRKKEMEK